MPELSLTLAGNNGSAHSWTHVSVPLTEIRTLLNDTGLDYANIQTNGLRTTNMRSHASFNGIGFRVRNATGGTLAANAIVGLNGSYDDGTDEYPTIVEADSGEPGSWVPAAGILPAAVADSADGTIRRLYELTGIDTSARTLHDPVYLSTTAGEYTFTAPPPGNVIQIIGRVTKVDASAGRISFQFPGAVVPYSLLQEVESV
jgi:hypothetical protein